MRKYHMGTLLHPWLQEVQSFTTVADLEKFMLEHGEQIVELLGSEVDRIEAKIKVRAQSNLVPSLACHASRKS